MIEKTWAQHFAAEWIAAWNAHNLELIAIYYRSTPKSRMVAEVLKFRDDGLIVSGAALYA
jgi:hypothetical protein